ncbi:ABC transporter substrate-binding protein [Thermobifida cellulosilytica]|uniref:ABC transporter substrate-binding protein n=1 Tax=Thermobifida cellulosilytica TB100 TaxID=665004 RepID=A0A147KKB6_THECS|nr:sugar ABC transporter substrate-binding protein [Thermobifida cellulosilytica]KUP97679.1 ABC transporter substrate-binding protein [Thermobifida cellulosilytica TB100]
MSNRNRFIRRVAVGTAALAMLAAAGCGAATTSGGGGEQAAASVEEGFTIGLLLPDAKTARYEKFDRPYFEEAIAELCPKCEVTYQNADQDVSKQQSQAEAMLTQGVAVLVLDAVDAEAAGGIVKQAHAQGVPVIAYDRLAQGGVDYYVSFDNKTVGRVQAEALVEGMEKAGTAGKGEVVMINGSPTDPNAASFKEGAHEILDGQVEIGAEYDTPDWSPDKAQQQMEQAITAVGADNISGVYSANDGLASGIIAALKSAGVDELPPITGQDAELAAIQRILSGDQYMTVYKAIRPEADIAAAMAVAAATGQEYSGTAEYPLTEATDGEGNTVPAVLLTPVAVTIDNIEDTVISDGFYTIEEICTDEYADTDLCKEAGA